MMRPEMEHRCRNVGVIPAKARTLVTVDERHWVPAFAGTTISRVRASLAPATHIQ